jgi:hypothetical protein
MSDPHNTSFKTRRIPIKQRSRQEQLATAFYPQHASPEDWKETKSILVSEGWKGNGKGLLSDTTRSFVSPLGGQISAPRGKFVINRQR